MTDRADGSELATPNDLGSVPNPVVWLVQALWQYKFLIIAVVVAGAVAAALLAKRLPDVYTAVGVLKIDQDADSVIRSDPNTRFVPPETITETEVEVLRSADVLRGVIERLELEYASDNPLLRDLDLTSEAGPAAESLTAVMVARLQRGLSVARTGQSLTVAVSFENESPTFSANVVNAVMAEYLGLEISAERDFTVEAAGLLSDRLAELRRDLDVKESAVEEFRLSSPYAESAGTEILTVQLQELNTELIQAQSAFAEAAAVSVQRSDFGNAVLPEVVRSTLIQDLRAQEAVQVRQVSELAALYRPEHPRLIQARSALAAIRQTIAEETRKIASSIGASEEIARLRVEALQEQVDSLRQTLSTQRSAELTLSRLERDAEASRRIYETFLDRLNELEGTTGFERPAARIIAEAIPPLEPSGPNRALIVAGGGIASSALAFFLVVSLALLDQRVRSAADVARVTGASPLVTIPRTPRGPAVFISRRRNLRFAEGITQLRGIFLVGNRRPPPIVIGFTAPETTEEAARLAVAFAQASAVSGDSVVLVDTDFEQPLIHQLLDGSTRYGLSDLASEGAEVNQALQTDARSDLPYIAAGSLVDPSLYRSQGMADTLNALSELFDVIVLALPALAVRPDAQYVTVGADALLIVAEAGQTTRSDLRELMALVGGDDAARIHSVLLQD